MNISPFKASIAQIAEQIQPFHVMKILGEAKALEAAGKKIIHMEIGEPDFPSLPCVHEAAMHAAALGLTHYTPTMGLPALRDKLSHFYQHFYSADVAADNIMITPGSSSALHLVLTAILNPGDKVLLSDPAYPCNRQFVKLLQGKIIGIPVGCETQYQLNSELLKTHWQPGIKAVMVASPANPTGTIIEQAELLSMANFLAEKNCYFIVDEIYQGLIYERPAESILAHKNLPNNVIVINSFSKYFGMTGWRLGWCIAPDALMPVLERLGQNLFLAASTPSQYGALRVLETDALDNLELRRQMFEARRNTLYHSMRDAGFRLKVLPQGAFYLYWDISDFTDNADQFCFDLLRDTGVAITPGRDFGDYQANQHVRLAYTTTEAELVLAVQKMAQFIKDINPSK
ncbi:aminotransferase class I/II-fold pyridoxal phosphate-dependent enzyme [Thiomicrorhabdus arctica]|uniref:aminotransferase class I/II-fold pyridoxal phosphate-dependent enzyme n=1 Tax=Thiomicrorhabdus arctica TaxID=131540 RepID=UPI0003795D3F|nr:aminotransferase class I/II-fold pyridoxal phosphate-dependent enzyme [Thiomicrorhabdus arctica]